MADLELLTKLDWLLGEWQGYGIVGKSFNTIHKRYERVLGGKFLVERTLSMFPPSGPSTDYETHQDLLYIYSVGESLRARGFYIEGYVTAAEVEVEQGGAGFTVLTTQVENGPPSMKTRYKLEKKSETEFEATFEIAGDGENFSLGQKLKMRKTA